MFETEYYRRDKWEGVGVPPRFATEQCSIERHTFKKATRKEKFEAIPCFANKSGHETRGHISERCSIKT